MHELSSDQSDTLMWFTRAGDVLWIAVAGMVAGTAMTLAPAHAALPLVHYLACALAFFLLPPGCPLRPAPGTQIGMLCIALAVRWSAICAIAVLATAPILLAGGVPWRELATLYVAGATALCAWRLVLMAAIDHLHRYGFQVRRVLIVGQGQVGREMYARARAHAGQRYHVVRTYFDNPGPAGAEPACTPGAVECDEIHQFVVDHQIDEVWIVLPLSPPSYLALLHATLRNALVDVKLIPETYNMEALSNNVVKLLGFTAIDLNRPGVSGIRALTKDVLDRLFAAVVLLALSPLFGAIALAVMGSSPGPILFRQRRLGLNGRPFYLYKFRSMVLHQDAPTVTQATARDPRVTAVGRFLRRTSLDELPQFFNVLMGDMSVVGPRPHALSHNDVYRKKLDNYMLRHRVKPGITGWAQINGLRGETDTDEKMRLRVQFDLHYIKHWSLWLDFKILVWTGLRGWTGPNAH